MSTSSKTTQQVLKKKAKSGTSISTNDINRFSTSYYKYIGLDDSVIEYLTYFDDLSLKEKITESRKIIQNSIIETTEKPDFKFPLAISESENLMNEYSTLDDQHREDIENLIKHIKAYLKDSTRKRPLNILMLAYSGAGKSHFINQLAKTMIDENVKSVTYNMATMQSRDDIAQPIDELRNLKVNDQFPLLFLDEFDSDATNYPLLLPLLWDGELQIGHRDLKLGKAVIVLAGSNPELPKAMDLSAKMRIETDISEKVTSTNKLIDLLSRINGGVITIPDLDLRTKNRDRRVDKVCIAVSLIRKRFGRQIKKVPRSLLRFISQTTFRYGVRSIAHLIDMIDSSAYHDNYLDCDKLGLPVVNEKDLQDSSLMLHFLDRDQAFGIVDRWIEFSKDKVYVDLGERQMQRFILRPKIHR